MKNFNSWLDTTNFLPPLSVSDDAWIIGAESGWKAALEWCQKFEDLREPGWIFDEIKKELKGD